ncbi:M91 family zinc metallopeptidase [Arthrospiribacter ruber]|uniref:M91 family zinc metallopeptidase n=1 Tax=Arthrospiribacter ruber TaxID=2487934 RepID=UPI0031B842B3
MIACPDEQSDIGNPWGLELTGLGYQYGGIKVNKYLYNGKELLDDLNLNLYDYGQRMYDPTIGRFNRIDRFSEKYYGLSPYQYGANNPISNIDINGDSIWVVIHPTVDNQIQTQHYYWGSDQQGNYAFRDQSGNAYQGNNQFIGDVANGLNDLMNGGSAGYALVTGLAGASDNVQIIPGNANSSRGNAEFASNSSLGGSAVRWDPNFNGVQGNQRPSFVALGHELAHSRDRLNSTLDLNSWFTYQDQNGATQSVPRAEISATHTENQIRAENGLSLRQSYTYDPSGSPTGTRIIFNGTRQSRYYNSSGNSNPNFRPIRRRQTPFTY